MIRLARLREYGEGSPTMPESIMKNTDTGNEWELAHMRLPFDESDDDIHNDVIHGVKDGITNSERV